MKGTNPSSANLKNLPDGDQSEPPGDRISSLPDSILCHILSFLPTKSSVSTSVLAKRWKPLWTEVPSLDFDCKSLGNRIPIVDMVYRFLLQHKSPCMSRFRVSTDEPCNEYRISAWTAAAIAGGVQTLDLHLFNKSDTVELPKALFTCKTLVNLKLNLGLRINVPETVCLPSLKKLHLAYVEYESDDSLPDLIYRCSSLEDLIVERFIYDDEVDDFFEDSPCPQFDGMISCIIPSSSIKRLTLNFHYYDVKHASYHDKRKYKLQIDAPAVQYLHINDRVSWEFRSFGSVSCLVQANISLSRVGCEFLKLFEGILYKAKSLSVSEDAAEIFCCQEFCPDNGRFDNLIKLDIEGGWFSLMWFLEDADNIEILVLRKKYEPVHAEPDHIPKCLSSSLKCITIHTISFEKYDFKFIEYILENAQMLERMEIYTSNSGDRQGMGFDEKFEALQKIAAYPRRSPTCRLKFH